MLILGSHSRSEQRPGRWLWEKWVHWALCLSFSLLHNIPLPVTSLLGPAWGCPVLSGFSLSVLRLTY